jgi:hypothetical protein
MGNSASSAAYREGNIRVVVFNHKDSGCVNNRCVFQAYSRRPASAGQLHHFTLNGGAACDDTCLALTIHRSGAGPTK